MDIKEVCLRNIGCFESQCIQLAPSENLSGNVTVFVGNNGSGKTSILKAIATGLSWFVSRLRSETGKGTPLPELVISNGKATGAIEITIPGEPNFGGESENAKAGFSWTITNTRKGRNAEERSHLSGASALANHFRSALSGDEKASLPLVAFYPVERVVLDVPLKIRNKHSFDQLDGYDNSLSQGVDFRRFFEWFRNREDTENETSLSADALEALRNVLGDNAELWAKLRELNASSRDRQLSAVRQAVSEFMPGFENLKVRRKPRLHMSIDKDGETFNVLQLSQGEKSLMALVGDIARRLAMMNPGMDNPLNGDGIILIDEVDLHLHPTWQRSIVRRLTKTFPNCQFVLTSHSPLVISDSTDILVYALENGELETLSSQYGQDVNSVLLEVMETPIRNEYVDGKIKDILDAVQENEFSTASALIKELESHLPNDSSSMELAKAKLLLKKRELKFAANRNVP
ncbi:AAA family ATPase [Rhodobacteraceae bacterium M382]|nr:AAA family ATPase [Rhodobacteraceae bacterium M382]